MIAQKLKSIRFSCVTQCICRIELAETNEKVCFYTKEKSKAKWSQQYQPEKSLHLKSVPNGVFFWLDDGTLISWTYCFIAAHMSSTTYQTIQTLTKKGNAKSLKRYTHTQRCSLWFCWIHLVSHRALLQCFMHFMAIIFKLWYHKIELNARAHSSRNSLIE